MSSTCGRCNGQGKHLEQYVDKCDACFGTGKDLRSDDWADTCKKCNGQQVINHRYTVCEQCHGSGIVGEPKIDDYRVESDRSCRSGDLFDRLDAARELLDAYDNYPPTYKSSNDGEYFDQYVPDPVTPESAQRASEAVDRAQDRHDSYFDRKD